jgi:inner membrane protein
MDNLTHSLVGAVLGQAGLKKKTGLAMPALIIGANLPDVDAACFFWLEGTEHLAFRRGITHGPPALVLLPLILAGLLWGWDRWQTKRGTRPEGRLPVHFGWLFALSFIGCLTHPAMDWLNVYGIRLLEPFSSQWFYGDTLFIIDPWIWAMLIAAVWVSRRREKAGATKWARPAQMGLAAMLVYIGLNGFISAGAVVVASLNGKSVDQAPIRYEQIIASPVPLVPWRREIVAKTRDGWFLGASDELTGFERPTLISPGQCKWPDLTAARRTNSQLDAFLFWSRAPFLTRAGDGSVVLRDARFIDPRVGDRFSLALPDVTCEELTGG